MNRSKRRKSKRAESSSPIPPRKNRRKAVVRVLGTGKTDDDGKKVPFEVKKGDRVLVSKYGGTEIKLDGKFYLLPDDIQEIFTANPVSIEVIRTPRPLWPSSATITSQ